MQRMLRLGSMALIGCLLVLAGGTAYAAKPKQAVFTATLTATLTKQWTYTRTVEDGDCTRTTRGVGRWQATLKTKRAARIRAIAASGGKVRFAGVLSSLGGSVLRSGTTTTGGGDSPCEPGTRAVRCATTRRGFANGSSSVRNPRRGVAQLGSLRGAAQSFPAACTNEPDDIRSIRTDLPLATAPLDPADVFGKDIRSFFLIGDTEQVTTLEGDLEGLVTERVRWRLTFTRVSG